MRAAALLLIAACANPPPPRDPAAPPPDQAMPVPSAAAPAGPPLPPPPPAGGAPMPPPPSPSSGPASPTVAPAPIRPPAPAPAGALPIAMGTPRAEVRAAFGTADPTGPGFDTFGSKGLVIGYHQDLVDTVTATTLAVGTTYRERILGVAIGDTVAHATATWGPQVSSTPGYSDYSTATYQTGPYRITVEIWKQDGNQGGGFGQVRAQTIKRIEVQKR